MVSVVREKTIDVHNYKNRLVRAVRFLKEHPELTAENKSTILAFLDRIKAENLSLARQVSYVQWLTTIARLLGKDFAESSKQDVEKLLAKINERDWSDSTKENHREAVKRFWRWLRGIEKGQDPEETNWFKVGKHKPGKMLPEQLLTLEECNRLIAAAEHPRDRAYVAVSSESGCRPSEILTMRISSISFDQYGAIINVNGKTGRRPVRLVTSAPLLAAWLDHHSKRIDLTQPLWINVGTTRRGGVFDYNAARKVLKQLALKSRIGKHVYPYLFRHSRATYLANYLTEAQMCVMFGWRQGSRMPAYYVHLSMRDIDRKMLSLHGLKCEEQDHFKDTVRVCARCQTKNAPVSGFCTKCGLALDFRAALDRDARVAKAESVLEKLLMDSEVKSCLTNKIRQLDLAAEVDEASRGRES
jgi:integrase